MRLAIADPPYLGRAALWYGGRGRSRQGPTGRACGRGTLDAEYHADAAHWDHPDAHRSLMAVLDANYDGWALAVGVLLAAAAVCETRGIHHLAERLDTLRDELASLTGCRKSHHHG